MPGQKVSESGFFVFYFFSLLSVAQKLAHNSDLTSLCGAIIFDFVTSEMVSCWTFGLLDSEGQWA